MLEATLGSGWMIGMATAKSPPREIRVSILHRYISTSRVAKHRLFVRPAKEALPSNALTVIAADDDYTHGILNSNPHVSWVTRLDSALEDRSHYTNETFETFPFPRPTNPQLETISKASVHLEQCRTHLKSKGKTLTEAYNALEECRKKPSPTHEAFTLMDAHERLAKAVFAAYGWEHPLTENEILERLLALNLERAAAQGAVAQTPEPEEAIDARRTRA